MSKQLDPKLNHVIVTDGGYWGKGRNIEEALSKFPVEKPPKKIPKDALVYAVSENTRFEEGRMPYPKGDPAPVLVQRGNKKEA